MRGFEQAPPEARRLLSRPIRELGLRLEGTPMEALVRQLWRELAVRGLKRFRPRCYLTDEWGCPSGEPIIGIPFYLADPHLAELERAMNDLEDEREVMMYLRHEAGHAFNYAYELYRTEQWGKIFGPFRRPYRDDYRPVPFSRKYVRHLHGWYAQKHPDEDFAETFAVWLTPRSDWRRRYRGWGAMTKLEYVERTAGRVGPTDPLRSSARTDVTVGEMHQTVEEFYREVAERREAVEHLPLGADLADIFAKSGRGRTPRQSAEAFITAHRLALVDRLAYWTGLQRPLAKALVESLRDKAARAKLVVEPGRESSTLVELTTYTTTLAMNYLTKRAFVHHGGK